MAYRKEIEFEIRELFKSAPKGTSEYVLEHFNQDDVRDTVNHLHISNPKSIQDSIADYSGITKIVFMK